MALLFRGLSWLLPSSFAPWILSGRGRPPGTLRGLAAGSPSPDLRTLLERYVCEERLASAMREVNTAVAGIYVLFVEPYLDIASSSFRFILAEKPSALPQRLSAGFAAVLPLRLLSADRAPRTGRICK